MSFILQSTKHKSSGLLVFRRRISTHENQIPLKKPFRVDPHHVWRPRKGHDDKYVRINGNTARDGHQSLIGGQHRIRHLEKAAIFLDKLRPSSLKYPGVEEVGGGTTVDFPLRYKGENPFENMRRITNNMPNTPAMCLTRSDSIVGYSANPKDVVTSFVKLYYDSGIDVFRNFDAYNEPRNHSNIAEAVIACGGHYQGAITYTTHEDPTLYNVKWVAQMAKDFKQMGAHSIAIKDMAGIASPKMMKAWVTEIKNAVPELPLIIHSHYTTGFAPITYLTAVQAGAEAIDCAITTLSGRTGHPSIEVMARVLQDLGYEHGLDMDACGKCADYYREINPLYKKFEPDMAGSADYRVFLKGIPGGQISIFKNELERNQLGHLFDPVMDSIQDVRNDCGGVALVTPTADNVARQTVINAMAKEDDRRPYMTFWSGYSEMLRGALGQPKQPMNEELQIRALRLHGEEVLKKLIDDGELNEEVAKKLSGSGIKSLQEILWKISEPIRYRLRIKEILSRVKQLESLNPKEREKMDSEICSLKGAYNLGKNVSETIQILKKESKDLENRIKTECEDIPDSDYVDLLALKAPKYLIAKIWSSNPDLTAISDSLSSKVIAILQNAVAFISVSPSTVLPNSLPQFRREVENLAKKERFPLPPEGSVLFEQYAVLYAIFKQNQNIALNFFKNVETNPDFWPPVPGDSVKKKKKFDQEKETGFQPAAKIPPKMFPFITKNKASLKGTFLPKWSNSEIERVMKNEIDKLSKNHMKQDRLRMKIESTQSPIRKDILSEDLKDLENQAKSVREIVKLRFEAANRAIPTIGYKIDFKKCIQEQMNDFEKVLADLEHTKSVQSFS